MRTAATTMILSGLVLLTFVNASGQDVQLSHAVVANDSLYSWLNCGGPGFSTGGKASARTVCCAYHAKKAYDSIMARREQKENSEAEGRGIPPRTPKEKSYCEQLSECYSRAYKQKQAVIEKTWQQYEQGLKMAGANFDANYNLKLKELESACYLEWNPNPGIMRRVNLHGPTLIGIRLANLRKCLQLAIAVTNDMQKIYGEIEDHCLKAVMKNDPLMPLCDDLFWDPANLYATIASLYEDIVATKIEACGQPLKSEDCCTVIPSKN